MEGVPAVNLDSRIANVEPHPGVGGYWEWEDRHVEVITKGETRSADLEGCVIQNEE